MIMQSAPWNTRSTVSRWAHVFERSGLALAGGACGLFVAAEVAKANIDLLGSDGSILAMMLFGAAGFYLGIDLPPPAPHRVQLPLSRRVASRADAVELLSAGGTFLAAAAAVVCVVAIILDELISAIADILHDVGRKNLRCAVCNRDRIKPDVTRVRRRRSLGH